MSDQTQVNQIRINRVLSSVFGSIVVASVLAIPVTVHAGLDGDAFWIVEKGDSVYAIARKVFPDDALKRKQFRQELIRENPDVFKNGARNMRVGARLSLPAFAVSKPVATAPAVIKPKQEVIHAEPPTDVVETVENTGNTKLDEMAVTPDPADVIGHVVINVGTMQAQNRGVTRKLHRHAEVLVGDTLETSRSSYTQIRMKDGALISLRPNTRLRITDYRYDGKEDGSERSFMELLSGGFRTITGYIGHRNKQNYRVKTAVATIGIRGTHYGVMVCADGSCNNEAMDLEDGVYGGVVDGSIAVQNETGETSFNNDQYFYVASATQPPVEQLVPPPVFHGNADRMAAMASRDSRKHEQKAQEQEGKGSGHKTDTGVIRDRVEKKVAELGEKIDHKPLRGDRLGSLVQAYIDDRRPPVVLPDQQTDVINNKPAVTTAPNGSGMLIAFTESGFDPTTGTAGPFSTSAAVKVNTGNTNEIVLGNKVDASGAVINNLPIAAHEVSSDGKVHNLALPSGTSGITDIGGNPIGVNWGRWTGNYELTEDGQPLNPISDLHFVYSDKITSPAELLQLSALGGLTAAESYTLAGGTIPTNAAGTPVALAGISVLADFINQQVVNYTVDINDAAAPGGFYSMEAVNVPFFPPTTATQNADNISEFMLAPAVSSPCTSCTGRGSLAFVGSQAEGAITTYSINDPGGQVDGADGAAVLIRNGVNGQPLF